jgi:hypothetical protein
MNSWSSRGKSLRCRSRSLLFHAMTSARERFLHVRRSRPRSHRRWRLRRCTTGIHRNQSPQISAIADRAGSWNGIRLATQLTRHGICPPRAAPIHSRPALHAGFAGIARRRGDRARSASLFEVLIQRFSPSWFARRELSGGEASILLFGKNPGPSVGEVKERHI